MSRSLNNILLGGYKVKNTLMDHERNLAENNSSYLDVTCIGSEQSMHSRNCLLNMLTDHYKLT